MKNINLEQEVIHLINKHKIIARQEVLDTLIGYARLGGNVDSLLKNPTFEYNDIFKEYRQLRSDVVIPSHYRKQ